MYEIIAQKYPKQVQLRNSKTVSIRILEIKDENALVDFFKDFPANEKALFRHDVNDTNLIRSWAKNIDIEKVFPLVAFDGKRMVANCTLYQEKRGWQSHIGKIRIGVSPDYRGVGLSNAIVQEFIRIAPDLGLTTLVAEIVRDQTKSIELFQELRFNQVAVLPEFVVDQSGNIHDLVVLALKTINENAAAGE